MDASSSMCEVIERWARLEEKVRIKGAFLLWSMWGERNNKVFNDKTTPHQVLLSRVARYVDEQGKYAQTIYMRKPSEPAGSSKRWCVPPDGLYKINVDVSLAVEGWIGLGVIARNHEGGVLFTTTRRVRAHWTPEIAEAKAIEWGVRLGRRFGLQDIILESDCQSVINRLSKNAIYLSDLDNVLTNILVSCASFSSFHWSHVKRDGNFVVHHLAKLIPFGVEQIWENHYPSEVAPYVLMTICPLSNATLSVSP
ncbi:uncharacterized protein LOC104901327 [Beta vulgaris subsp. vulgaris]|uniref:uncharacterized protein LOC104901327 n=1 Tax=Beta vulgaris subsp. vulgaris TaxID=3555 RepID=UPI00053FE090|nr:uncharacterized protein LOC104901327 [Beta vulgaris subsp. vulgaris]